MMEALQTFTPITFTRTKGRLQADDGEPRHDARIVEAIARAHYWQGLLDEGRFASISDLARAERLQPTTVARLLRLVRLAPDVIESVMGGEQPRRLTLYWLQRHDIPMAWGQQRAVLDGLS